MTEPTTSIIIDCPVCHRTIWAGSTCYHGYAHLTPPEEKRPDGKDDKPSPVSDIRKRKKS